MWPASASSPCKNRGQIEYAGVVELVDSKDLGSFVERRAGSSPAARTMASVLIAFETL